MEYYIGVIKDKILYSGHTLVDQLGWIAVGLAVVVLIGALIMFGKNVKWKR